MKYKALANFSRKIPGAPERNFSKGEEGDLDETLLDAIIAHNPKLIEKVITQKKVDTKPPPRMTRKPTTPKPTASDPQD